MESRRKKKVYVDELEAKLKLVYDENISLKNQLKSMQQTTNALKQELTAKGGNPDGLELPIMDKMNKKMKLSTGAKLPAIKDAKVLAAVPLRRSQRDKNNVKSTYLLALVLSVMLVAPTGPRTKVSQESMKTEIEGKLAADINAGQLKTEGYLVQHRSRVLGDPGGFMKFGVANVSQELKPDVGMTEEALKSALESAKIELVTDGGLDKSGSKVDYNVPIVKAPR